MNIKWQVKFKSLRAGTDYTVNIYDSIYTGNPIVLKGGAEPFSTEEDADEDPFIPVRIQTGYLRIVDDGYAADGTSPFDWKELAPSTDHSRPVTLTTSGGSVVWQGFLQAQDFNGTLYGNPQEREFPVHCALSILNSQQPSISNIELRNFAYVLNLAVATAESLSVQTVSFDYIYVQGGADAQQWLLKKFDWMNVLREDENEDIAPQYNIYEIVEDMCRFWGWTIRTKGRALYLTCYDDSSEQTYLRMTRSQLRQMGAGNTAGTTGIGFTALTLQGDIFASANNDDYKRRGPNKATVNADCNEQSTVFKFAPPSIEKQLDNTGYTWVDGAETSTGYFTTSVIRSFESLMMRGIATQNGGFVRRQIYASSDQDNASKADIILASVFSPTTPVAQLTIRSWRNYGGGSLSIKGNIYQGAKMFEATDDSWYMFIRLGIGADRASAKWYQLTCDAYGKIYSSWISNPQTSPLLAVHVNGNSLNGFAAYNYGAVGGDIDWGNFSSIPVEEGLNGQMFIDIMGFHSYNGGNTSGDIADFEVTFSRDVTYIQSNTTQSRARTMTTPRVNSKEYIAENTNASGNNWDADCIFASDNNMKYGYGLLMNADGTWMKTARYGSASEHPEQHLANRVTTYWTSSKRQIIAELRSNTIADINPLYKITVDSLWRFNPIAISRNWRDDVMTLVLLQTIN